MKDAQSCQILQSHGLHSPRNSPGQNTGVLAFPFSRGPSQARDWTQVSRTADGFFTSWATVNQIIEKRVTIRSGSYVFEPQKTKMFGENSFNRMPTTDRITNTISILGNNAITIPIFGRENLLTKVQDLAQGHTHTIYIY